MKTRKIQGTDIQAALREVRRSLGPDAVIMSTRETAEGIEVIAGVAPREFAPVTTRKRSEGATTPKRTPSAPPRVAATPTPAKAEAAAKLQPEPRSETRSPRKRTTRRGTPVQHPAFATLVSGLARPITPPPPRPDVAARLDELGLAGDVRGAIVESVKDVASEQLLASAFKQLQGAVRTTGADLLRTGGRIAVLGGTGVGKTTTIAKLAAHFARLHGADSVALINADQYRIGASDQLRRFARLLGVSVVDVYTAKELDTVLNKLASRKLVLVDTAGIAHGDSRFAEQIELLRRADLDCYLALSLNTQTAVLSASVRAWAPLTPRGLILTKEDEAVSLGGALSMAVRHSLPVSFVTTGPNVPADIKVADSAKLVARARAMAAEENSTTTSVAQGGAV